MTAPSFGRQGRGPAKPEEQLFDAAFALVRLMGRRFRRESDSPGLTPTQYHVLAVLGEQGPISLMEAAALLKVAGPTATRTVEALARRGLVDKDRDPQDRRIFWLRLTVAGERLLARERADHVHYFAGLMAKLAPDDAHTLVRLLGDLVAGQE